MVKISIDKDYDHLFEINAEALKPIRNDSKKFVEVSEDLKKVCSWLEESEDFRGMAYLPFPSTPKLLHLLHQKVENTVIIITEYHSYWLEQMQEISRLSKIRWGFLNLNQ
jgi:ribosomal protein L7Ae-like RNA K-turn-binding protein